MICHHFIFLRDRMWGWGLISINHFKSHLHILRVNRNHGSVIRNEVWNVNNAHFLVSIVVSMKGKKSMLLNDLWSITSSSFYGTIKIIVIFRLFVPYENACLKKFEYDSRLKADLIKFIKLNSTFLDFYFYFGIPESS